MSRATNDLKTVRMVLGPRHYVHRPTLITMVMAIVGHGAAFGLLDLVVLLPVPVVFVAVVTWQVIHDLYETIQAALATLSAKVQENLSGVRVIRAYAQEEAEFRGFDEPNRSTLLATSNSFVLGACSCLRWQALIGFPFDRALARRHQLLRAKSSRRPHRVLQLYRSSRLAMIALGWSRIFSSAAPLPWGASMTSCARNRKSMTAMPRSRQPHLLPAKSNFAI